MNKYPQAVEVSYNGESKCPKCQSFLHNTSPKDGLQLCSSCKIRFVPVSKFVILLRLTSPPEDLWYTFEGSVADAMKKRGELFDSYKRSYGCHIYSLEQWFKMRQLL